MTAATLINTCTVCGAEEGLDALLHRMIDDDQVRRLIAQVVNDSLPLGALVVRYLRLHKPAKQRLRMKIVAQLLAELVPDMTRGRIERSGRSWVCDGDGWKAALQAVFDAQDKGTLGLPLQGNGYLYQVLMNMADKTEAVLEKQTEQTRRAPARQGFLGSEPQFALPAANPLGTVRSTAAKWVSDPNNPGQTMTIGEGLQVVFAGRDATLARLESAAAQAVPMPESVKAYRRQLGINKEATP